MDKRKTEKEEKSYPVLLLSVSKAGKLIIFVFSISALENNCAEPFPLFKKYLIFKINKKILFS